MIPYCQQKRRRNCTLIDVTQQKKLKTAGGNLSHAMRFSNYVRYFGRSRGVPVDLCTNGHVEYKMSSPPAAPTCTSPIFSPNWRSHSSPCGCNTANLFLGKSL